MLARHLQYMSEDVENGKGVVRFLAVLFLRVDALGRRRRRHGSGVVARNFGEYRKSVVQVITLPRSWHMVSICFSCCGRASPEKEVDFSPQLHPRPYLSHPYFKPIYKHSRHASPVTMKSALWKILSHLVIAITAGLRPAAAYSTLSDASIEALPYPAASDFDIHTGRLLAPILIPRVPGTPGSDSVLRHFVEFFTENLPHWTLTFQNSTSTTPASHGAEVPFRNLIATRDPPWLAGREGDVGRLILAAHFDSKLTPTGFIGATDSAAPCAMLLHIAQTLDAALTAKWSSIQSQGLGNNGDLNEYHGLQILLLDGEEAFHTWTHTDSLYGARALAEEWERTPHAPLSTFANPLASIDMFVLLDLLGAMEPRVPSYYKLTHWAYVHLANVEARMRALHILKSRPSTAFLPQVDKGDEERWEGGFIEDDHLPFLQRGVDVLHIIPSPFPRVWHTMDDDGAHLDLDTVTDWAAILTGFVAEWMEVEGYLVANERDTVAEEQIEDRRKAKENKDEL